jgi:hypothetical protein
MVFIEHYELTFYIFWLVIVNWILSLATLLYLIHVRQQSQKPGKPKAPQKKEAEEETEKKPAVPKSIDKQCDEAREEMGKLFG